MSSEARAKASCGCAQRKFSLLTTVMCRRVKFAASSWAGALRTAKSTLTLDCDCACQDSCKIPSSHETAGQDLLRSIKISQHDGKTYHKECTGLALDTVNEHTQNEDITFFGACFCPFVQRVGLGLEALGIPYQVHRLEFVTGDALCGLVSLLSEFLPSSSSAVRLRLGYQHLFGVMLKFSRSRSVQEASCISFRRDLSLCGTPISPLVTRGRTSAPLLNISKRVMGILTLPVGFRVVVSPPHPQVTLPFLETPVS